MIRQNNDATPAALNTYYQQVNDNLDYLIRKDIEKKIIDRNNNLNNNDNNN